MRLRSICALLLFAGIHLAYPGYAAPQARRELGPTEAAQRTLLRNVRLFDVATGEMTLPRDLLIEGDTISAILPAHSEEKATRQIECRGKYAIPGLFDSHTHLAQLTRQGEDSLKKALFYFAHYGVLHVRDAGGPIDVIREMSRKTATGEWQGPEIYYTGPMLESSPLTWAKFNEDLPGFTVAIDTEADVDSLLPALAAKGAHIIKTFNHIDPALYRHVVEVAHRCSLEIVHDPGTPLFHRVPMDLALDLGVTSIEHAKAPWPVVLKDELRAKQDAATGPGANPMSQMAVMSAVVEAGLGGIDSLRLRDLSAKMVAHDAYLCPTLHVFIEMAETAKEKADSMGDADSTSAADSTDSDDSPVAAKKMPPEVRALMLKVMGAMEEVSRYFVREMSAAGVKMLVGQDGIDPQATLAEMRHMQDCGVPRAEILRGATIYPARWLKVDDRLGSIEPGKLADLVVVSENPLTDIANMEKVLFVMQRGVLLAD